MENFRKCLRRAPSSRSTRSSGCARRRAFPACGSGSPTTPPPKPFVSDGCSLFFDEIARTSIYPACFFHDLKYWCGYPNSTPAERLERFIADAELMIDVATLGVDFFIAETIFRGVRTGGGPFGLPFSWEFGRV